MIKQLITALMSLIVLLSACVSPFPPDLGSASSQPDTSEQTPLPPDPPPDPEPEPEPEPEPTDPVLERAMEILAGMTTQEKVGQLFLVRCPDRNAAAQAEEYQLGGYLLFARDFRDKTPDQVRQNIASYQAASKIPMLIAVDEEGGTVVRVSAYPAFRSSRFLSPQRVYAAGGLEGIRTDTQEKAELLASLGINVNLAPVCDVSTDQNDFIYARSLGQDAQTTGEYAAAVVEVMNEARVGCALKHFPGYGSNRDTHTGIAIDQRPLEQFETCDLLPFQAGIDAGAPCVLVAHTIVSCMDPDLPASLSPAVHRRLRDMGFDGVILTDDLAMDGIRKYTGDQEAAVLAVLAGNDLLCCTSFQTQVPAVLAAVEDGTISQERLDESVLRVLLWKLRLGLIDIEPGEVVQ